MLLLILGFILGPLGIIPPEYFDDYKIAMVIELLLDFPLAMLGMHIENKIQDKLNPVIIKINIKAEDMDEVLDIIRNFCDEVHEFGETDIEEMYQQLKVFAIDAADLDNQNDIVTVYVTDKHHKRKRK